MLKLGEECKTPENTNGICIELTQCPALVKEYGVNTKNPDISKLVFILLGYNCDSGQIQQNPIVCCDDPSVYGVSTRGFYDSDETCTDPNGLSGVCKSIKECPAILGELNAKQSDKSFVRYLKNSNEICDFIKPNVCCPDKNEKSSANK